MRPIGVWTQGLRLSFPDGLLGSGAKGSAKQGSRSVVQAVQEPGVGHSWGPRASSPARTQERGTEALPPAPQLCLPESEPLGPILETEVPGREDRRDLCPLGHSNSPLPNPPLNSIPGTRCRTHV